MIGRVRHAWPPSIRTQLALLYAGVFALILLLIGGAYYAYLQSVLQQSFASALQARAQLISSGISLENGTVCIQDVAGLLPGLNAVAPCGQQDNAGPSATEPPGSAAGTRQSGAQSVNYGDLVRILNGSGKVVYSSPAFGALAIPQQSVQQPLQGGSAWSGMVAARTGADVQIYSAPLTDSTSQIYGVVQVGEPLAPLAETLQDIVLSLLVIAPFALLLSALASYWLAGRAFRPILRLTRTAREIEAEDLHQRVPVPTARDEVRDLALTLNGMIARLERAFAQQRRFVADASHELRTPVAAIRSLTDVTLAEAAASREALVATLCEVNAEAERLGHLISDLLALARADEGQAKLDSEPVRLDIMASEVTAVAEPLARERGITLEVVAPDEVVVQGDEARLTQVAINLIDNAIRYTERGGHVVVRVTTHGGQACLAVADTGVGIAGEHVPFLFERFFRIDPARLRGDAGSGLGLAIVDWVVRAHGGTVVVESEVGRGSTFTVTLPLATAPTPSQSTGTQSILRP